MYNFNIMDLILQVFLSVFSGVILSLSIPNEIYLLGNPYFTLVSLVPFYITFKYCKSYKSAFWLFFIQAITTHLISSFWLAYFKDFAIFTLGASAIGTGIIAGGIGILLYIPFSTSKNKNILNSKSYSLKFLESSAFKVFYFSMLYTIYEWVKSSGFLGYPWGTISSGVYKWNIIKQIADITGTYGITFFIVIINCLIAEVTLNISNKNFTKTTDFFYLKKLSITFCVFGLLIFIYGNFQYNKKIIPQKELTTIMVQQNSNPWEETSDSDSILRSEDLTKNEIEKLKKNGNSADLVVWSEGVLRYSFPTSYNYYSNFPHTNPLIPFIKEIQTPLLIGGSYEKNRAKHEYCNSAFVFDKYGNFRGYYGKNHLVPFAESLPFREYPIINKFLTTFIGISAGWVPGDQYVFFDIPCKWYPDRILPESKYIDLSISYSKQQSLEKANPTVRISTPICFDDAFTDVMRPMFLNGAELFVNITDDSWSKTKSSEYQHFVIASYRAIEYRTTLVRSSNSGYSVVVNPQGKVIADQPLFEASALTFNVPIYKRNMTTYAKFGNWLPYTFIILFFLYAFYMIKTFSYSDYVPSHRKIKLKSKKKSKKKK